MFDGRWRSSIEVGLKPIGRNLHKAGVRPDHLTVLGVLMATAAAVAIGNGALRAGLLLIILTGVPDALDGAVAKASGTASQRGAYFDSVADRLTDALLLGGVAWYLASQPGAGRIAVLPFAVYAAASLVSYQRAKADALGYDARGGLMERAERFVVLAIGLLFSELLIPVLWVMLVATAGTAGYRFVKVWRQADRPPTPEPIPESRRRRSGRRAARPVTQSWRNRPRSRKP
ncbi:MAG: CDP-alcohol phosphatidyltransferase family protein [Actinomycetota bacterium]